MTLHAHRVIQQKIMRIFFWAVISSYLSLATPIFADVPSTLPVETPRFSLNDLNGKSHSLDDWKGKIIMLNFWATWCPPCQYEVPHFIRFQKEYAHLDLQIIGIAIDDLRPVQNFARTFEINYPVLITNNNSILNEWGNEEQILPFTVFIDRKGEIINSHQGIVDELIFEYQVKPLLR